MSWKATIASRASATRIVLADEQARKTKLQADFAEIRLQQERRQLIPVLEVEDAMAEAAGAIVRILEAVPGRASDFAAAVARDDEQGARRVLKEMVRQVRAQLGVSMTLLADKTANAKG